jgi:two-component system, OmpR family, sensor histidine kinase KdpD
MKKPWIKSASLRGLLLGLAGAVAVVVAFSRLPTVNTSTVGFSFLMVVLGVATTAGFRVSAVISVVAMLCFNFFFLPPVGRLTIADPENWVSLIAFLLTALVASHLSDRVRKQAAEAGRRQQETEQLYALSRAILLTESLRPIGRQAAQSIAQIFAAPAVMILDAKSGQIFRGGAREVASWQPRLEEVVRVGSHQRHADEDLDIWPISLGGSPMGALGALGIAVSDGAVQSMLNLVAIALERVRTEETANRAEAARQSEEFKSTLLDAMAHEFKTPLTSIKAAATGLRTLDPARTDDRNELTSIIVEETDRLSQLVTEAVKIAEIDAGKVRLHREPMQPAALLRGARQSFEGRGADRIQVDEGPAIELSLDRDLMTLAIRLVLDNALKYSGPDSPVTVQVRLRGNDVTIRIEDRGPGIPERDRHRVFEKFYRRANTRDQVPGTGLGLHIAREITQMHGGELWVESAEPNGAAFCFRLPLHGGGQA